jgi:Family of unknown function (DUF6416)
MMTMNPQTRPDMVQVTFEVPDRLLGQFYIAVGAVLKQARGESAAAQAGRKLRDWGTETFDQRCAEQVWRKFSPRAQAVFSLLMDNPGVAMSADEIATKIGLANGRHGLAGVVAWPSRQCAEMGLTPPFRFDNPATPGEMSSYWMDPETAQLFIAARERSLARQADIHPQG